MSEEKQPKEINIQLMSMPLHGLVMEEINDEEENTSDDKHKKEE